MDFKTIQPSGVADVESLFVSVFSQSEGAQEGALIGNLAKQLMTTTSPDNLYGFAAVGEGTMVGAIFFSRLTFPQTRDVFILAPVAVQTTSQGKGIGQALITHGLQQLKQAGVAIAVTYGDPAFYGKVGFQSLSQATIPAPLPLSQPEGWLGQSLTKAAIAPIPGPCSCVAALNHSVYW